jgi:hypothetical protein
MLITPLLSAPEDSLATRSRGWLPWRGKAKSHAKSHTCEPSAFAEQLVWSLRRVHQTREERVECPSQDHGLTLPAATVELAVPSIEDRRAHQRFSADQLQGLQAARIAHGPSVRLLDCSAGGALVETEVPLRPDSEAVLELISDGRRSIVPFRVVRCEASVVESRLIYWGACAFSQPLEVTDLLQPGAADSAEPAVVQVDRFDNVIKEIVEQHSAQAGSTTELVTSLRDLTCSSPGDPAARAINGLLAIVIAAVEGGEERSSTLRVIEQHLQVTLPWSTPRFAAAPMPVAEAGSESLYLTLPAARGNASGVLNVELPQGVILEDWQFRLLKASTYLATLLRPVPESRSIRLVTMPPRSSVNSGDVRDLMIA